MLEALRGDAAPGRVDVLALAANGGKAEAVRAGLLHALRSGPAMVAFADADLSAPLAEVRGLQVELDRHPEAWAALGSRVKLLGRHVERSAARHYLGRVFATAASMALDLPVYDTQCGLKLFRDTPALRDALDRPFLSRWIFDVELIARLAAHAGADVGTRIREVPLEHWEERGSSRISLGAFLRAPIELWRVSRMHHRR
jgi:glycosyltransferase involved in cell wall biosynthesis